MSISCRLCVTDVTNDDAELMKDIPKDILATVLIKSNIEDNWELVICRVCYKSLLAAFEFKSTCMRTNDAIMPYVDWENPSGLDLRDIYLREVENKHTVILWEDEKVCRLCMELVGKGFVPLHEMDLKGLHRLLPEIHVDIIKDAVVCKRCFDSFTTHSNFLKDCLDIPMKDSGLSTSLCNWDKRSLDRFIKTEELEINSFGEHDLNETEINENVHMCIESKDIKNEVENTRGTILTSEIYRMIQKEPSEVEMYQCGTSNQKTRVKSNLKIDSSQVQMYKCDICDHKTKSKSSLKRHQLKHADTSQVQMYKCDICDHKTKFKSSLKRHQLKHADTSQVQMYKCDTCDYQTKIKDHLKIHLLKHKDASQVQLYKCASCKYKTRFKSTLKRHQWKHADPSQVKMYKCDTCGYKTKFKSNLKNHQLKHKDPSEVQMYECNTCDYETRYKRRLKSHQLKHADTSQVQMYKCGTCDYQTKIKGNLKIHLSKHKDPS